MKKMRVTIGALALGLANIASYSNDVIEVKETGVVRDYSANKVLLCDNIKWDIKWNSNSNPSFNSGEIIVFVDEFGKILTEANDQVFKKFLYIESVSATCNPGIGETPTRTTLMILGHAAEDGKRFLARGILKPNLTVSWFFETVPHPQS